jgi:hypothetical protein
VVDVGPPLVVDVVGPAVVVDVGPAVVVDVGPPVVVVVVVVVVVSPAKQPWLMTRLALPWPRLPTYVTDADVGSVAPDESASH